MANGPTTAAAPNSAPAFIQGAGQPPALPAIAPSAEPIQINLDDSTDDIAIIDSPDDGRHVMNTGPAAPSTAVTNFQPSPRPDSPDGFVIDLDSDFEQDMLAHASALTEPPLVTVDAIAGQIKQGNILVRVRTKVVSMAKFAFKNHRFSLITILQDTVGTTRLKTKLSHEVILQVTKITPEEFAQSRPETKSRRSMELLQRVQSSIAGLSGVMTLDLAQQCALWQQHHDSVSLDSFTLTDVNALPLIIGFHSEDA
ncbi:hypothetical protein H4R35_005843 [Dimargaris xerosporica]|nr:hypothetical protein H4R35_005843 [Dimargaris xerosporica]